MRVLFHCKNKGRRNAVLSPKDADGNPINPTLNGIDYLEVSSVDQKTLKVYFLHNLPGEANPVPLANPPALLSEGSVLIEGGVRVKNISIKTVTSKDNVLTVEVNEAGDFSTYKLMIVASHTNQEPPSGFDPQLSSIDFSFKVACPSDFDCKEVTECPPEKLIEPDIDYLAKDYASFRRLMLDRMSVIMPGWSERNPADLQITLVELMAYAGDYLSYYQDAVATEAYLGTARKRVSVRRHARLLDYFMHNGCNARTWVCFEVDEGGGSDGAKLPAGKVLLTKWSNETQKIVSSVDLEKVLNEQPLVFETMHDLTLQSSHNRISFYTWSDSECCLARGSTKATLLNEPALSLGVGDILIFEEVLSPTTGTKADANLSKRHAVRLKRAKASVDPLSNKSIMEIEWYEEDALPFPLCISARVNQLNGPLEVKDISVAWGNVVLADHGLTLSEEKLIPSQAPDTGIYRPQLWNKNITFSMPYYHDRAENEGAVKAINQDPRETVPSEMRLKDSDEKWSPKRDLLGSDRFAAEFVVEIESDGSAQLRFGDDVSGKKPSSGSTMLANYRVGNGREGNIGPESIGRVVWEQDGIKNVRNPISATGGKDAETMEEVRQFAPQAFRTQKRAVTEDDYEQMAEQHEEVQKAAAMFRWTGSWYTVFIAIDRKGGYEVDKNFKETIRRHLGQYRLAGYDLEINGPIFISLDLYLTVCVQPGYFQSDVKKTLFEVFSCYDLNNGKRGFFHPDNFTFGQPVYLSQIYKHAMGVTGVDSVIVDKFQRWGKLSNKEKENGVLTPSSIEIVRLDNDPNFPENGKIDFKMYGGL